VTTAPPRTEQRADQGPDLRKYYSQVAGQAPWQVLVQPPVAATVRPIMESHRSTNPRRDFRHRAETFGLDTAEPWALPALRILFSAPRVYQPLVQAWEGHYPGVTRALERMAGDGWIEFQDDIVIDTRTGDLAARRSRPVARYRTTAKGQRLLRDIKEDLRALEVTFPKLTALNTKKVARLLDAYNLSEGHAKLGVSVAYATTESGLAERSGRWWTAHLLNRGYLRELASLADTRSLIPAHYRVTRALCRQILDVIAAFPDTAAPSLATEFRLNRSRFLGPIDPARVGVAGATDFDHDVHAQEVLALLLRSPSAAVEGVFAIEPRIMLELEESTDPPRFRRGATGRLAYQPDAEMRERNGSVVRRSVIEYERYQSRRDAWSHIERFCGYLHTHSRPFEPAVLRFVVDSDARVRSYVQLVEAFADHVLDNPEHVPGNHILLAVTSIPRLRAAADPLDERIWFRIEVPHAGSETTRDPVLHREANSPYENYFGRG
jgi:DNA-binding PadR family transcriptional regulator